MYQYTIFGPPDNLVIGRDAASNKQTEALASAISFVFVNTLNIPRKVI